MTSDSFHWFVLAGGLSPYTLDLWERVTARSNHRVTLAHVPREYQTDFVHESEPSHAKAVELVPVESLQTVVQLGVRCSKTPRSAVVCMGYSPIYNLLLSVFARAAGRNHRLVLYVSDANGVEMVERMGTGRFGLLVKRALLGRIFSASLDLGFSNSLAHRLLRIPRGIDIPMLPVEFPDSREPELPEPLGTVIRELPRPRLLSVARLVGCKNLVSLLYAFAGAIREGMPGSLTIVGEGPDRARLDPLLSQMQGRAILPGALAYRACRGIFGAFDGVLMPSISDQWGIVILEALGWAVPVLSSRRCGAGVSMALETGDAVKLCGTAEGEIQSGLVDFVRNLERHTAAAKAAAPWVRRKFGMDEVADALIKLGDDSGEPSSPPRR